MAGVEVEAPVSDRDHMNTIIREISITGRKNLTSADVSDYLGVQASLTSGEHPDSLQRVVSYLNQDPEHKVSRLRTDKFVLQRSYGATSFIYLANGHK